MRDDDHAAPLNCSVAGVGIDEGLNPTPRIFARLCRSHLTTVYVCSITYVSAISSARAGQTGDGENTVGPYDAMV